MRLPIDDSLRGHIDTEMGREHLSIAGGVDLDARSRVLVALLPRVFAGLPERVPGSQPGPQACTRVSMVWWRRPREPGGCTLGRHALVFHLRRGGLVNQLCAGWRWFVPRN